MDNSKRLIMVDNFSFDDKFNKSEASKVIIKQRIILNSKFLKLKHSETYFISEDNQILLISYSDSKERVQTMRIFCQDETQFLDAEDLINQYAQEQQYTYIYSKTYDVSKYQQIYEFLTIQATARDIAVTPYTRTLSNCNFTTLKLINQLYPEIQIEWEFKYYGSIDCQIF